MVVLNRCFILADLETKKKKKTSEKTNTFFQLQTFNSFKVYETSDLNHFGKSSIRNPVKMLNMSWKTSLMTF